MTDRWGDQPAGFNRAAAEVVYKAMTRLDDEDAAVLGRVLVAAVLDHQLVSGAGAIAKALNDHAAQQATRLRKQLAREAVSKSRAGQDPVGELRAMAVLEKAFDFTEAERQEYTRRQQRDLQTGRF